MKTFNGLPVYHPLLELGIDGVSTVSLVDDPAVQKDFLKFSNQENVQIFSNKQKDILTFSADEEKQNITGVLMLADTPIYRKDSNKGEFYMVFTKEDLTKIVYKFFKDGNTSSVNLQHNSKNYVDGVTMFESYMVDKERGLCPEEFKDIPDGSWLGSYHIEDKELWKEIKESGELNGFSIEITSDLEPLEEFSKVEPELKDDMTNQEMLNLINKLTK